MGMCPGDFRHFTPAEFEVVTSEFSADRQEQTRDRWECMRLLASITIQPHVRRKLTPRQLLPLPWDKDATTAAMIVFIKVVLPGVVPAEIFGLYGD